MWTEALWDDWMAVVIVVVVVVVVVDVVITAKEAMRKEKQGE